jgi:hypothetical protein
MTTKKVQGSPYLEKIAEWQKKHGPGNIIELSHKGLYCYIFTPSSKFEKWKQAVAARRKSLSALVDYILNNCWLDGDASFKSDEDMKLGIEDQIDSLIDVPDAETTDLENGNVMITCEGFELEVRLATRMDIQFAKDRNRDEKPLLTQEFLLERIAVDLDKIEELKKLPKVYAAFLYVVNDIKKKKEVQVKKF